MNVSTSLVDVYFKPKLFFMTISHMTVDCFTNFASIANPCLHVFADQIFNYLFIFFKYFYIVGAFGLLSNFNGTLQPSVAL